MPDRLQRVAGLILALMTGPLLLALGLAVRLETPGPALYKARRVGPGGRPFECLKLRTMRADRAEAGPGVTGGRDTRVTRVGGLLRRLRLDELPQLWNVAKGEMRFVGPRPEDPRYVDLTLPLHRQVFTAPPGIAGLTQLVYADEGRLLDRRRRPRPLLSRHDPATQAGHRRRLPPAPLRQARPVDSGSNAASAPGPHDQPAGRGRELDRGAGRWVASSSAAATSSSTTWP